MTDQTAGDAGDRRLTRLLREWYAPPGAAYWDALEGKILARVGAARVEERGWASSLEPWVRVGLAAAGIAIAAASLVAVETRSADARRAYEVVIVSPPSFAVAAAAARGGSSARDATLEYVISH